MNANSDSLVSLRQLIETSLLSWGKQNNPPDLLKSFHKAV